MEKTVVVMQPGYLPWLGFFELVWRSDIFVIYDTVQFDKNGWRNRNRIKTPQGVQWLTVPVSLPYGLKTKISQVIISIHQDWRKRHLLSLQYNYKKAPFFELYWDKMSEIINQPYRTLLELAMALIFFLTEKLRLKRTFVMSSELPVDNPDRILRLLEIIKAVGGTCFYEAQGGKKYIGDKEVDFFRENGVAVEFQDYQHPEYHQLHGVFTPYLSLVDLLFNEGPQSLDIITWKKTRRK